MFLAQELYFSPTKEPLKIAGIPLGIFDNHQDCFPFWYKHGFQKGLRNAVLVRVDDHPDFTDNTFFDKALMSAGVKDEAVLQYTKSHLSVVNFNIPAAYLGMFSTIVWAKPSNGQLRLFKDISPELVGDHLKWGKDMRIEDYDLKNPPRSLIHLLKSRPIATDYDLDGFGGATETIEEKINMSLGLISQLRRPNMISISRSAPVHIETEKAKIAEEILREKLGKLY